MKTTFSLLAILVFSAVMLTPKIPKEYPPKEVLEQRAKILKKKKKLEQLISTIENTIAKDSLALQAYVQ